MVVSITSMKVGMTKATATIQGLIAGRLMAGGGSATVAMARNREFEIRSTKPKPKTANHRGHRDGLFFSFSELSVFSVTLWLILDSVTALAQLIPCGGRQVAVTRRRRLGRRVFPGSRRKARPIDRRTTAACRGR